MWKLGAMLLSAALLSSAAQADGQVDGRIVKLSYDPNAVLILTDGAKSNNPACSTSTNQFSVPLTNTTVIAFLLSARATGTVVHIGGSGACTTLTGVENFYWIAY